MQKACHAFLLSLLACGFAASERCLAETVAAPVPSVKPQPPVANKGVQSRVRDWFTKYDSVRRNAQMTHQEKATCKRLMALMMNPSASDSDKNAARNLLGKQISRYAVALQGMRALPKVPETAALADGYYNYFRTASLLFSDYRKVLDNPLASDGGGKPVLLKLAGRKNALENLNNNNKALDARLRAKYGIPAYKGK